MSWYFRSSVAFVLLSVFSCMIVTAPPSWGQAVSGSVPREVSDDYQNFLHDDLFATFRSTEGSVDPSEADYSNLPPRRITCNINFTTTAGVPPARGTFIYDFAIQEFVYFTVIWDGTTTFNLITAMFGANSPHIFTTAQHPCGPPCLEAGAGKCITGGPAGLALMTGACKPIEWLGSRLGIGQPPTPTDTFRFLGGTGQPTLGIQIISDGTPPISANATIADSHGMWSVFCK